MKKLTSPVAKPSSNEDLQKQLDELRGTNEHLRELLQALQSKNIKMSGYLYKYRPFSLGLLSNEWELRYFTLYGNTLKYHKNEKDLALHPRGQVDVSGCVVELEGRKGQYWTFGVVNPLGHSMLRLSSKDEATAVRWVEALEAAGCKRRTVRPLARTRSPLPGADIRWKPSSPSHLARVSSQGSLPDTATAQKLQERWEESDSDSDVSVLAAHKQAYQLPLPGSVLRPHPPNPSGMDSDASSERPDSPAPATPRAAAPAPTPRDPMVGSTPVHSGSKYSLLSSERISLHQHSGLLNLVMVILLTTNFRLILENLLKYGLRFNPVRYVRRALAGKGNLGVVVCFPGLLLCSLGALALETYAANCLAAELHEKEGLAKKEGKEVKRQLRLLDRRAVGVERVVLLGNVVNTTVALLAPCVTITYTKPEVMPGLMLVLCTMVVWMKLVSYAHCNFDLRQARRAGIRARPGERPLHQAAPSSSQDWLVLRYPENLTVNNTLYFLAAPTLTYQVNFPRSSRLRKRWLMRRVAELLAYLGLLLFIAEQYLEPTVANSLQPLRTMDWPRLLERVLKLALPNMYAWLAMFYCLFHLWLNILAELLRFGDREFYKDWWNAPTLGDYWRLWNMPVHKWLLRTIYFPAIRHGVPKTWAMVFVFFVSAVAHEVCVGVPLHMVRFWAFAGIMLQVPMVILTDMLHKKLKSDTLGNLVFWFTFCVVGQPVSLLMYYHDYLVDTRPDLLPPPGPGAFKAAPSHVTMTGI